MTDDFAEFQPRIEFLFDKTGYGGSWNDGLMAELRAAGIRLDAERKEKERLAEAVRRIESSLRSSYLKEHDCAVMSADAHRFEAFQTAREVLGLPAVTEQNFDAWIEQESA